MRKLIEHVREFNELRNWQKLHNPRSLVLALCGEIGELAQLFRWHTDTEEMLSKSQRNAVEKEIADIFIFLFALCVELDVDPERVIRLKLTENEQRFPVDPEEQGKI